MGFRRGDACTTVFYLGDAALRDTRENFCQLYSISMPANWLVAARLVSFNKLVKLSILCGASSWCIAAMHTAAACWFTSAKDFLRSVCVIDYGSG